MTPPPRIIMEWREATTHLVRFFRTRLGHDVTYCNLEIAHDLRYVAPEGTIVLCLVCLAAEPP